MFAHVAEEAVGAEEHWAAARLVEHRPIKIAQKQKFLTRTRTQLQPERRAGLRLTAISILSYPSRLNQLYTEGGHPGNSLGTKSLKAPQDRWHNARFEYRAYPARVPGKQKNARKRLQWSRSAHNRWRKWPSVTSPRSLPISSAIGFSRIVPQSGTLREQRACTATRQRPTDKLLLHRLRHVHRPFDRIGGASRLGVEILPCRHASEGRILGHQRVHGFRHRPYAHETAAIGGVGDHTAHDLVRRIAGIDRLLIIRFRRQRGETAVKLAIEPRDLRAGGALVELRVTEPGEIRAAPQGRSHRRHGDQKVRTEVPAEAGDQPLGMCQRHILLDIQIDAVQLVLLQGLLQDGVECRPLAEEIRIGALRRAA